MERRSDTTGLWTAIFALAMAVVALFVVDPFGSSADAPNDGDFPFVAFLARDEIVEEPAVPEPSVEPEVDEVLGIVTTPAAVEVAGDPPTDAAEPTSVRGLRATGE